MTRPLAQVAEVALGRQRSPQYEFGDHMTPYLRSANVADGSLNLTDVKEMNFDPRDQAAFGLRRGDVLITEGSGSRATVGTSAVWLEDLPGTVCFQNTLLRVRPRRGLADGRYLAWWARHAHAAGLMANVAGGANILHLSAEEVRRLPIPNISLDCQERIADFLDDQVARIDGIVAGRDKQIRLIELEQQTLVDILTSVGDAVAQTRLGHFVDRIDQGWSPQCDATPAESDEWGVLKVSAIRPGRFIEGENKKLPEGVIPKVAYEVEPGDLFVTRANTPKLVGAFAVAPCGVRSRLIFSDKIMRIRLAAGMNAEFVALVGQSSVVRSALSGAGTGTSQSMVNIRADDIRDIRIPVVEPDRQVELVRRHYEALEHSTKRISLIDRSSYLLQELKRSLITAAVTGEFDVTAADGWQVPV